MDPHTAGGGFDTSTLMHRRQESNTSNRIRSERHRGPPSEKALRRPIEPRGRHTTHDYVSQFQVRRLDRRTDSTTAPVSVQSQKLGPELRVKVMVAGSSTQRLWVASIPLLSGEHPRAIRPTFAVWRDIAGRGSAGRPRAPCRAR